MYFIDFIYFKAVLEYFFNCHTWKGEISTCIINNLQHVIDYI